MKKYICPELEYVMMDSEDMITTSGLHDGGTDGVAIGVSWYDM